MKIKPLGERVLLKRVEEDEQIRGGIIIPDSAKEKSQEAEVVALGTGKKDDNGKTIPFNVKKGDKVLYHAAAGALGQILCPWANALGAEVIGTVGSKAKEEIAKKNGCHHVINYSEKNFSEEVEKIVGKNGIDVVYDGVGIKTFKGSIETLKIRGMMVACLLYTSPSPRDH